MTFWEILDKVLSGQIVTESHPAKIGNVEFWKDNNGNWCYDIPVKQWDQESITKDITRKLENE